MIRSRKILFLISGKKFTNKDVWHMVYGLSADDSTLYGKVVVSSIISQAEVKLRSNGVGYSLYKKVRVR